jgi:methionine-rich copper-binding protein CopC
MFAANPAAAHPKLASSVPAANAILGTAPSEIRLVFTEPLESAMSGVEIKNEAGKTIETLQASVEPTDRKQLAVSPSAPLKPGTYSVSWHAVAADTHRVKGVYSFTVNP